MGYYFHNTNIIQVVENTCSNFGFFYIFKVKGEERRTKMKKLVFLIVTIILIACNDNTNEENKLTQADIDRYTGYAIIDSISQLYNINLAGKSVGGQNLTTTCPSGGNVTITGSTGYSQSNGITTVDLIFQMTDCQTSRHTQNNIDISLILSGNVTFKGSFNSSTGYNATNHQSDSLKISASIKVQGFKPENVNDTCKFSATTTNNTVSGYICGRQFSY